MNNICGHHPLFIGRRLESPETHVQDEKFFLLQSHPCSAGLPDDVVHEIADKCELVELKPDDVLHESNHVMRNVYLVILGRLKLELIDMHGRIQMQRFLGRGSQYGGLGAALSEPIPIKCTAVDPTKLLQIDYQSGLELTSKHEDFRTNLSRLVADGVKRTLFNDKLPIPPKLVAFFHQSEDTRGLTRRLMNRLVELGENPNVLSDQQDWKPIPGVHYRYAYIQGGKQIDEEQVRSLFKQWYNRERIIVDVDAGLCPIRSTRILSASDMVFWCVTPKNWRESVQTLKHFEEAAPGWREKVCLIWLMDDEVIAPYAPELNELAKRDIKISFADPQPNYGHALQHGFQRLVQLLRGVQIGVALGGGAARGMAHLGVLKALEDSGIVVDMIAGTSAGAMTGTVYASGLDVDYSVGCFVNDLRPSWFFRTMPKGDQWYLLYKYRRGQFDPMLRKYLHYYQLEQLPIPMNSITVDLISGKVVVRDVGDSVRGIIESINLPVLSSPVIRQGQALVDGGMINNVPADVLVAKGCNFVIAVSVTAKMEMEFARNRPDTPQEEMRSPSTLQTILRTYLVQSASVNALGVQPADVVIEPDVTRFELTDFVKTDELSDVGESATLESISQIRESLSMLDPKLFPRA